MKQSIIVNKHKTVKLNMNERILVNMLLELKREEPNDMEFGGLVRQLLYKYEQRGGTDD